MKASILLVGDDLLLLRTRALLLAQWRTEIVTSSESLRVLSTRQFDIVIIGQLVPAKTALAIIEASKALYPIPSLMAIRFPGDELQGIESHTAGSADSPRWLRECVARILCSRLRER
jgi:hypothetical protein